MGKKPFKKGSGKGGWLFFGLVLFLYASIALCNYALAKQSFLFFGQTLIKVLPVLVLVFCLILILNLILSPQRVKTYVGAASGIKGWLLAIVAGILSTGPIYAWYVLLSELKQKGMKTSLLAVFLYSRAIKLPLLPLLVHYFSLRYTLVLSLYLVVFSIISGVLTEVLVNRHHRQRS